MNAIREAEKIIKDCTDTVTVELWSLGGLTAYAWSVSLVRRDSKGMLTESHDWNVPTEREAKRIFNKAR